ncbi:MAG: hypothetical protein GX493_09780 [Firmicutes bacterium]|nr:hypothetical protein [Bacillota bacterium]
MRLVSLDGKFGRAVDFAERSFIRPKFPRQEFLKQGRRSAPYAGWRITYRFHPANLFDYQGDRLSLARSYAESLQAALTERFPGAEVKVDWNETLDPEADPYICVQWDGGAEGHGMTRAILDDVIYLSDKVYYEGKFFCLS